MAAKNDQQTTPVVETPPVSTNVPQSGEVKFNPLEQSVNEKSYSGGAQQTGPGADIPEYQYQKPPDEVVADAPEKTFTTQEKKQQEQQAQAKKDQAGNPDLKGKSDQEKTQGAAAMADGIFKAWEWLYSAINKNLKISEKTINKLQADGLIDVRLEVPYKMGVAPLTTVFRDYNNDAADMLVVEEDFKKEAHPMLTEELAKGGHGLSNIQQLGVLVTIKLINDGAKFFAFKSVKTDYINFAKDVMKGKVAPIHAEPAPVNTGSDEIPTGEAVAQDNIVSNNTGQEDPDAGLTLQEKALKKHLPGGVNNSFNKGDKKKLNTLNRYHADELKNKKSAAKKNAKAHVANAKAKVLADSDVPQSGGNKRGKGRPKGAKNKPK
jgi:hypothetical protein